jgi:hypothetical protein
MKVIQIQPMLYLASRLIRENPRHITIVRVLLGEEKRSLVLCRNQSERETCSLRLL